MPRMMHLFRKYQYILLVVFGVLLMVVFVVGDALQSMGGGGPSGGQADETVVVSWKNGRITDRDLQNQLGRYRVMMEFLQAVAEETQKRGGSPQTDGLLPLQNERDLVRNILLAEKAMALGLKVDDDAVKDFLYQFSNRELENNDFAVLIKTKIRGRISEKQLLDQLRQELLAQHMFSMLTGGLRAISPRDAWNLQDRTQRRVKTEMVALNVDDFKDKVTGQPSEQQIQAMYDEGKNRFSHPSIADFGFRKRQRAAFEYVRADFGKFQEEEAAKIKPEITDEDIEKHYEENKDRYKVIDLPSDTETGADPVGTDKATEEKPNEGENEGDADPAPTPEGSDEAPKKPEESAEEKSDPAPKPEEESAEGDVEKPAEEKPRPAASEPEEKAADSSDETDTKSDEGCAGLQEEAEGTETPAKEEPAVEKAAEEEPTTKKEEPAADVTEPAQPATEKAAATEAEEKPADPPAKKTEEAATDSGENAAESEEGEGGDKEEGTEAEKDETKYKPLNDELREEIRDEIAKNRAREPAQDRLSKAMDTIQAAIDQYGRDLRLLKIDADNKPPASVDYEALAGEHGMTAGKTDLADPIEIEEYELGKSYQFSFAGGQFQQIPFSQMAYADDQLYRVKRIRGSELDVEFLYWKTDQKEGYVPELDEVRDEIVDAWKKQEALVLAKAAAEDLVKELADKKPSEVLAEREDLAVLDAPEFSWMTRGFAGFGGGGQQPPSLSTIEGVELAGNDFMRDVFKLGAGQTGVAVNQPETHIYVVHVVSEFPPEDVRRERFLVNGITPDMQGMAMGEFATLWQSWYADFEAEMNVVWNN